MRTPYVTKENKLSPLLRCFCCFSSVFCWYHLCSLQNRKGAKRLFLGLGTMSTKIGIKFSVQVRVRTFL